MNLFGKIVLQIAIHLLTNEYILNMDYVPGSVQGTRGTKVSKRTKIPAFLWLTFLGGGQGVQNK